MQVYITSTGTMPLFSFAILFPEGTMSAWIKQNTEAFEHNWVLVLGNGWKTSPSTEVLTHHCVLYSRVGAGPL